MLHPIALAAIVLAAPIVQPAQDRTTPATVDERRMMFVADGLGPICQGRDRDKAWREEPACHAWLDYLIRLERRGWCFGRGNESAVSWRWHHCTADSISRLDRRADD